MTELPLPLTRDDLRASGMSVRRIAAALASGALLRVRRDRYLPPTAPADLIEAVRIGGRLTCLSLLRLLGVFVFANDRTHAHLERGASRLRSPSDAARRLEPRPLRRARLHWPLLIRPHEATSARVGVVDALAHAVVCQPARHAVATLDSALNRGLIRLDDLADVFAALPQRYRVLRALVDGRAQSGTETLVRLMARAIGCTVELQVRFDGVGFVDLLLDGWLVVECDSREFHSSWEQQVKDRERDLALAALGYTTLRVTAAQVFGRPDQVTAALRALLAQHRGCRVS